jgi:hypothetical protein
MALNFAQLDKGVQRFIVDGRGKSIVEARKLLAREHRARVAQAVQEAERRGGTRPETKTSVDGRLGASLDQVKERALTTIDVSVEILDIALMLLRQASPVDSGEYRTSHAVIEGARVSYGAGQSNRSTVISNTVPYARRLEIGVKKDGSPFVADVPPRIYERVARELQRRYDSAAIDINFAFVELPGGYVIKGRLSRRVAYRRSRRSRGFRQGAASRVLSNSRDKGKALRYPAIVITRL